MATSEMHAICLMQENEELVAYGPVQSCLLKKGMVSHWFCRCLNAVTKMDVFPLPRVDDTLDMLSETQCFSTLDLTAGY